MASICASSRWLGFEGEAGLGEESVDEGLTPGDFPGLGTLSHALLAFVNRYNRTARPFNWKFTANDLTALLRRIAQHEQAAASQKAALPQAA
jgi:hypothetical protein